MVCNIRQTGLITALIFGAALIMAAASAPAADTHDNPAAGEQQTIANIEDLAIASGQKLVIVPADTGMPMDGIKLPAFSGLPAPVCYVCDDEDRQPDEPARQQEDAP